MQLNWIKEEFEDYSDRRVLIGLSGGINSAAVLCHLGENCPRDRQPKELHLYYAHFTEHSPDTFRFCKDLIHYARKRFQDVRVRVTRNSVLKYFKSEGIIPHPTVSPCTINLKIVPMQRYAEQAGVDCQLVGFVRHEMRRINRQKKKDPNGFSKYPIQHWTDEDCLSFVKSVIGWYPAIYDIRENGKRVFAHNNCLPCKNMHVYQIEAARKYYPGYIERAEATAREMGSYWGRAEEISKAVVCDACERLFI